MKRKYVTENGDPTPVNVLASMILLGVFSHRHLRSKKRWRELMEIVFKEKISMKRVNWACFHLYSEPLFKRRNGKIACVIPKGKDASKKNQAFYPNARLTSETMLRIASLALELDKSNVTSIKAA